MGEVLKPITGVICPECHVLTNLFDYAFLKINHYNDEVYNQYYTYLEMGLICPGCNTLLRFVEKEPLPKDFALYKDEVQKDIKSKLELLSAKNLGIDMYSYSKFAVVIEEYRGGSKTYWKWNGHEIVKPYTSVYNR